jgi:hypothetical protein
MIPLAARRSLLLSRKRSFLLFSWYRVCWNFLLDVIKISSNNPFIWTMSVDWDNGQEIDMWSDKTQKQSLRGGIPHLHVYSDSGHSVALKASCLCLLLYVFSPKLRRPTLSHGDRRPWHSTFRLSEEKVSPAMMSNNRLTTLVVYHCWNIYKLSVRWVCFSYQVPVTSIHALNFTRFMHLPSPFTRPKSQMTIQFTTLCNFLLDITIAATNPLSTLGW